MAEDLSAEIRVGEIPPKVRVIQGVATSTMAFIGLFPKGPVGVATFISGPDEAVNVFGTEDGNHSGPRALKAFFKNGGARCYVTRTMHYTDINVASSFAGVNASKVIDDRLVNAGIAASGHVQVDSNAIEEWAQAQGFIDILDNTFDVGDLVTVNGVTFTEGTEFSAGGDVDATAIALRDAINASVNVLIDGILTASIDPGNSFRVLLTADAYGVSGNSLTLAETDGATDNFGISGALFTGGVDGDVLTVDGTAFQFGVDIAVGAAANDTATNIAAAVDSGVASVGAAVTSGTPNRVTITAAAVGVAGNAIALAKTDADDDLSLSGATLTGGQDVDAEDAATVTAADGPGDHANGRIIRIAAPRNGLADHFKLQVVQGGVILDTFDDLNLIPASANYAETRINGKQGELITFSDEMSTNTASNNHLPALGDHAMASGDDGLTGLIDTDFIGTSAAKNGLFSWEPIEDKFALAAVPERATSAVQLAAHQRAELKKHYLFLGDLPQGLSASGAVSEKNNEGLTSEYRAHFWPELVVTDEAAGAVAGDEVTIGNSSFIGGLCARVDNTAGKGVAKTPAGINDGRIFGVKRIASDATQDKGTRDLIFPEGINPIWSEQGIGIINDGGRLSKLDGLVANMSERRVFIFVETSVKLGIRFARHENIDDDLFNTLNASITVFSTRFWRQGGLKGRVASEAFFVNTESGTGTINPPSEQEAQRVNVEVGLATKKPAYFITVNFTVDQRALLEEIAEG